MLSDAEISENAAYALHFEGPWQAAQMCVYSSCPTRKCSPDPLTGAGFQSSADRYEDSAAKSE